MSLGRRRHASYHTTKRAEQCRAYFAQGGNADAPSVKQAFEARRFNPAVAHCGGIRKHEKFCRRLAPAQCGTVDKSHLAWSLWKHCVWEMRVLRATKPEPDALIIWRPGSSSPLKSCSVSQDEEDCGREARQFCVSHCIWVTMRTTQCFVSRSFGSASRTMKPRLVSKSLSSSLRDKVIRGLRLCSLCSKNGRRKYQLRNPALIGSDREAENDASLECEHCEPAPTPMRCLDPRSHAVPSGTVCTGQGLLHTARVTQEHVCGKRAVDSDGLLVHTTCAGAWARHTACS